MEALGGVWEGCVQRAMAMVRYIRGRCQHTTVSSGVTPAVPAWWLLLLLPLLLLLSRFSRPTLCDPIDGSPPGSPVPGILQARTLECVAISFSNA